MVVSRLVRKSVSPAAPGEVNGVPSAVMTIWWAVPDEPPAEMLVVVSRM
jgi:hypothetical protein